MNKTEQMKLQLKKLIELSDKATILSDPKTIKLSLQIENMLAAYENSK